MSPRIALPLLLLAVPAGARAQDPAPPSMLEALNMGFTEVSGWILKAAESVPRASGARTTWAETVALSGAGKAELLDQLRKSIATCTAAHTAADASRSAPLVANYGHASLHYGNIVTYLRMLGITPPSS
jgi:hypothetical protein